MTKPISHRLDIYGDTLHLATTKKTARTLTKRYGLDYKAITGTAGSTTPVFDGKTSEWHCVIWLDLDLIGKHANPVRELIDTAAHESSHAADAISDRGLNDEARAYLVGWITGWIWEHAHALLNT